MTVELQAFEFLERCRSHGTVDDLLTDVRNTVGCYGFDHLMMSVLPSFEADVRELVMLNGWPPDWFERYVQERYYQHDAVTRHAIQTTREFYWDDVPQKLRDGAMAKRVKGEAAEFGLCTGYVVPVYTSRSWQAVMSLGGSSRLELNEREEGAVLMIAHFANRTARQLLGEPQDHVPLTPREREVVTWTAMGKTVWEVSVILSCSQSAVKKHLYSARNKLDASTNPQLVAEAIRKHEISL